MGEEQATGIGEALTVEESAPVAPAAEAAPEAAPEAPAAPAELVPDRKVHIALDLGDRIEVMVAPLDEITDRPQVRELFLVIAGVRWMHVGEHRGVWLYRLDK